MNNYLSNAKQQQVTGALGSGVHQQIPEYGGDCALQQQAGLSSAINRNAEVSSHLTTLVYELENYFGLSFPEKECQAPSPLCSPKDTVDACADRVLSANAKLNRVLEHLRS